MTTTFQNSASVLSIGIFFTVITLGLAATLPSHLYQGLTAQGVSASAAHRIATLPPIGVLFASFLGYNPIQQLLQANGQLGHLSAHQVSYLTGRSFFPHLITAPFGEGLHYAFDFAILCSVIAAVASWSRGSHHVHAATNRSLPLPTPVPTPTGASPLTLGQGPARDPEQRADHRQDPQ
jgi:hypothetical protein